MCSWRLMLRWPSWEPGSAGGSPRPPESVEEAWPRGHLDFRFLASKRVREQTSIVVSHQVWGHLLQQPWTTNTNLETLFAFFPLIPSWAYRGIFQRLRDMWCWNKLDAEANRRVQLSPIKPDILESYKSENKSCHSSYQVIFAWGNLALFHSTVIFTYERTF